ncbi:hypothetical protein C0995_003323 [Termitomyces sp. Mi166|nr:hypothetical protein C0995_003323 [Termitomyces sp. Mi166\
MLDPDATVYCIVGNPDISGVGIRVAIYIQNFLSFLPAISALWDKKVTLSELDSLERQSTSILITALAILISTIIQAHRPNGITNYHASIVLDLSWMNNTNLFIYFLLYAYRRAYLTPEQRKEEDIGIYGTGSPQPSRTQGWAMKVLEKFFVSSYIRTEQNQSKNYVDEVGLMDAAQHQKLHAQCWYEAKQALKNPVIIIGSLHLTLMAAIGIWLWSHPASFGSSKPCSLTASTIILGMKVPLGSDNLRIWSILVYSVLLIPGLNLIFPITFFAILLLFRHQFHAGHQTYIKNKQALIQHHQVVMGLVILVLFEAFLLIDTELTISKNQALIGSSETQWTFGQTLALLVLLVPLRDLTESVLDLGAKRQRKRLLLSASKGAIGMVQVLLDLGAEKPDLNGQGRTAAMLAAEYCHGDIVKFMLGIKETDEDWKNPVLHTLLEKNHRNLFDIMIKCGADLHIKNQNGKTVLHLEAENGHQDTVEILLKEYAYVNARDNLWHTALHLAAENGHQGVVKILVDHQADLNAKDKMQKTALHLAVTKGQKEVVQLLLKCNADVHEKDEMQQTALYVAAASGQQEIIKMLLEHNADVHEKNEREQTALHIAAAGGHQDIIKILLEYHGNVHARSNYSNDSIVASTCTYIVLPDKVQRTALHVAATYGHQDIAKLLIKHGANVHAIDMEGSTALHVAASHKHSAIVQALLEHNVDVQTTNQFQQTALHLAVASGHQDTVKLLLDHHADSNARGEKSTRFEGYRADVPSDQEAHTALHLAVAHMHQDIVEILLKHNADVYAKDQEKWTVLHWAAALEQQDTMKILLKHHADVNAKNEREQTALHIAAAGGYHHIVKVLLECGVDIHIQGKQYKQSNCHGTDHPALPDERKQTALHIAAAGGYQATLKILLKHSAHVNERDENGQTALHLAVANGYQYLVEILLEYDADVNTKDKNQKTPLDLAQTNIMDLPYDV